MGGEDYELLFTAAPETKIPKQVAGVAIHAIGKMKPKYARDANLALVDANRSTSELKPGGWQHFRR